MGWAGSTFLKKEWVEPAQLQFWKEIWVDPALPSFFFFFVCTSSTRILKKLGRLSYSIRQATLLNSVPEATLLNHVPATVADNGADGQEG